MMQAPPVAFQLLEARESLANLLRYMDGKAGAEDNVKKLLSDPALMKALKEKHEAAKSDSGGDA